MASLVQETFNLSRSLLYICAQVVHAHDDDKVKGEVGVQKCMLVVCFRVGLDVGVCLCVGGGVCWCEDGGVLVC
ncbi:MAG: hypothetical protein J3R72DRAFT_436638 [Linnemannia gamsii]|nr:MAG: hypothetical protein J3R72DRAFT_436638 [Linnemannia gamsii]